MSSIVLNSSVGKPYDYGFTILAKRESDSIIASLFEQLLIFDKITITTNRVNFALSFLISKLGINVVERLLEEGYINFLIWSPSIVTGTGTQRPNGMVDRSTIYGQPPIVGGSLTGDDLDPEKSIALALKYNYIHRDRAKAFTKKAVQNYIIPDGMLFAVDSAKLTIDAYEKNNLASLGLPFVKESNQLDLEERAKLQELSHTVLETSILSHFGYKSYEKFEPADLYNANLENIGRAYQIADNTAHLFDLNELPDLKKLYLNEKIDFEKVFKIRKLSTAKYYRKWINEVGETSDANKITREYIKEITGKGRFFKEPIGKMVKKFTVSEVVSAVASLFVGPLAFAVKPILGMLEISFLDDLLLGKTPKMFIERVRVEADLPMPTGLKPDKPKK